MGRCCSYHKRTKTRVTTTTMKTTKLGLKAKTQYSTWVNSNWHCYYHALSGDELKTQIISIFYKPTGDERSWSFEDVSDPYKKYEEAGIKEWVQKTYCATDEDSNECVRYVCQFLNDARKEFSMEPIVKEVANG